DECEDLYRSCAIECANGRSDLVGEARRDFLRRMVDLSHGLMLKIFVGIAYVDRRWSAEDMILADELFEFIWNRRLNEKQLKESLNHFLEQSSLSWDTLLGPFERLHEFRNRAAQLQTVVMRLANLVAKSDGKLQREEARQLEWIQVEMRRVLERIPLASANPNEIIAPAGRHAVQEASLAGVSYAGQSRQAQREALAEKTPS